MEIPISIAPVAKSLTTAAFERLRSDILLGDLRPSERLRIQGLSKRYQIGPTAIREALSRLVTEGLVESQDQRGFCVVSVSTADLTDLTQTRVEIETLALQKAIKNGGVEWEAQVISSYHRLSRAAKPTTRELLHAWAAAHRQFHQALLSGCNSRWLVQLCLELYDKSERYRNLAQIQADSERRDTVKEHSDLMQAVAIDRDAARAIKLISSHFWATTNIILRSLDKSLVSGTYISSAPAKKPAAVARGRVRRTSRRR